MVFGFDPDRLVEPEDGMKVICPSPEPSSVADLELPGPVSFLAQSVVRVTHFARVLSVWGR